MTGKLTSKNFSLEREARIIVSEATGNNVVEAAQIKRGVMTFKYAVELSSGDKYIVRFYPSSRMFVVGYEPDIINRCSEAGLPTPEVLIDSRKGPKAELEYVIYKMIDGIPLSDVYDDLSAVKRSKIAKQIVNYLNIFTDIPMVGFGDLIDGWNGKFDCWPLFLQQSFKEGMEVACRHKLFSKEILERLKKISGEFETFPPLSSSVLAWGDISTENILVNEHSIIVALLDFESVMAADPLINLGYCHARSYGSGFFESIIDALSSELSEEQCKKLKLYSVFRALRIAKFSNQPLPTGLARERIEFFLPGFPAALKDLL